jgi:N-acylglucosamine-6-phosphate 2-epimerase
MHFKTTRLVRGIIVSCQAREDNPLHGPSHMTAMARAAAQGGAVGVRANGPADIRAIKKAVGLPVIGIYKHWRENDDVYITPDMTSARAVAEAGADVVALDATDRPHPEGTAAELIRAIKGELGLPVFADIATRQEGMRAAEAGADYVATTLAGYTSYTRHTIDPDLKLLGDLVHAVDVPVIAEGRFWHPEQVENAFALGAFAVVVGTAITNPREITRRFTRAVPQDAS